MTQNIDHTRAYVKAITGYAETVMDWRIINDRVKGEQAQNMRGTIDELWSTLTAYNLGGYGVFCNINAMDGNGYTLTSVAACRTHVVDLDNVDAAQQYQNAVSCGASFATQSSTGKFHCYWSAIPYVGNERYTAIQRKLAQYFNGDKSVIDAARVMRVPGFYHMKGEPQLVKFIPLSNARYDVTQFETWLASINVFDIVGVRSALGEPSLSAPSLDWLNAALNMVDPNDLDRGEWLSISAAYKQAGWLHTDEDALLQKWLVWCAQYGKDDPAENRKLWNSIRDTECGWATFERRTVVKAYMQFGDKPPQHIPVQIKSNRVQEGVNTDSEILDPTQCAEWFKGCVWVDRVGQIFTPNGRFMNSTQFNGSYGGKQFIIDGNGKMSDEPWKAALRSTVWTVPKVDHVRFLPDRSRGEIVFDDLKRKGLNTYIPATIRRIEGDPSRWIDWLSRLFPNTDDRNTLIDYLAHCVQHPGKKIMWSPVIQSAEGTGKTIFRELLCHALGQMYVYQPKAQELVKSGSTFNGWMRNKLMIIVDEIKIDERRELIEILKPMISDNRIEVQSKGVDQEMEDNPSQWLFFSNYKDAIPVSKNGRRYAIFYSVLQSLYDIEKAGMNAQYFKELFKWLNADGYAIVTDYLFKHPLDMDEFPIRAPITTSYAEALSLSRSPAEQMIFDCIQDGVTGFRGGFVSSLAVANRCKHQGLRVPSQASLRACLELFGYKLLGRSHKLWMQEDTTNRADIYATADAGSVENYGKMQGYE